MISVAPMLTNSGQSLLIRGISGEQITFTRFKIGNGDVPSSAASLTDLVNPVVAFSIDSTDVSQTGYIKLEGHFDSTDITSDFRWKELGIFAKGEASQKFSGDGSTTTFTVTAKPSSLYSVKVGGTAVTPSSYDSTTGVVTLSSAPASGTNNVVVRYQDSTETLYAYCNDGDDAGLLKSNASSVVTEQKVIVIVAIGTAQNVTAIVSASAQYASKSLFDAHVANQQNPHNVTAAQLGLGNVPNVSTNNQTPTYTVASSVAELSSGETLADAFGKIARAIKNFISHVASRSNPHSVTAAQAGAAAREHTHSATDINAGILSVARGGTGCSTAAELRSLIGYGVTSGVYFGDGTVQRFINLGFTPTAVLVLDQKGMTGDDSDGVCGGLAVTGRGVVSRSCGATSHETSWNNLHTAIMITTNGFWVSTVANYKIACNTQGKSYRYIAFV